MKAFVGRYGPILLGALFIYSGTYKFIYPGEAAYALASLDAFRKTGAIIVPIITVVELYLGLLLLSKQELKVTLAASMILMLIFTSFLWYLSTMAHPPACGCMGLTNMFHSTRKAAIFGISRNCIILLILKQSYDFYFPEKTGAGLCVKPSTFPASS